MPKSLLIVESPTKAKTLGRYLGKDFTVMASVGHVKDLPKNKLGIDLEKEFEPDYRIIRGKKKVVTELRNAALEADVIYLGPDPDREGEAIAWHISEELGVKGKPIHRVLFYELTKKAIQKAVANPSELNRPLYEAQQARRILDRLVGYQISPILWEKVKRGLSAGRVQSVALRLICEREKQIQAFDAEEYWTIHVRLKTDGSSEASKSFSASLLKCRDEKCSISSGDEARGLESLLSALAYRVSKVERSKKRRNPSAPFITSTLQQESARKLNLSARQTMSVAQRLYEGIEIGEEGAVGLITYMRTDSTRLSDDAVEAVRSFILETRGVEFLPEKPLLYENKQGAQDAHEAIRPTDVTRTPELMQNHLSKEQLKLYELIWKRFVASQMSSALFAHTSVDVTAGEYTFHATGSTLEFPGFMSLYVEGRDNEEEEPEGTLPELSDGQDLFLGGITPKQHFTQPPPRFGEPSLIRELEERGIGRPSTYATILSTILDREYVKLDRKRLFPTELGTLVDSLLAENFPAIVDVEFTAKMEESLDEIEKGKNQYLEVLSVFYQRFAEMLEYANSNMLNLKSSGLPTDLSCPKCGNALHIRWSRNGPFMTCSTYPECRFSSDYGRDEKGRVKLLEEKVTDEICDKCGKPMTLKRGRYGQFLACSGYPECKNTKPITTGVRCPAEGCDGELVERSGRAGRPFYGCNRYPLCKTAFRNKPVPRPCPNCGAPLLFEKQDKNGVARIVCGERSCKYEERENRESDSQAV